MKTCFPACPSPSPRLASPPWPCPAVARRGRAKPAHHPAPAAPIVRMVTTKGTILIKLYPKDAPITVANFEKLVKKGFYNGLKFHRIADENDPCAVQNCPGRRPGRHRKRRARLYHQGRIHRPTASIIR